MSRGRLTSVSLLLPMAVACSAPTSTQAAGGNAAPAPTSQDKTPNILVIFGDDIGQTNVSAYDWKVVFPK